MNLVTLHISLIFMRGLACFLFCFLKCVSEQTKFSFGIPKLKRVVKYPKIVIVLEPVVTKLKPINRIREVWSARSPPPAADALPSSPTLPGKQSFASLLVTECHSAFWKLSQLTIRTFSPEFSLEFVKLCVKQRIPRRSVAASDIQPVNLINNIKLYIWISCPVNRDDEEDSLGVFNALPWFVR